MKHSLYAIAFILLLPINILIWLFWFLPMYKKGTFEDVWWRWDDWSLNWDVSNESEFYKKAMKGWWGFVIGCNIVFVDYFPKIEKDKRHIIHESCHVLQNYMFNILFYPAYILCSLYIWVFQKGKHAYYDNPFEIWARRSAGQNTKIDRENWAQGPNDRWPWW